MTIELGPLISVALAMVGAYAGIAWRLLAAYSGRVDEKFLIVSDQIKALAAQGARNNDEVLQLERELAALRLEMMRDFTRREDHNQAIASIRVGLDNMSLRIEKALSTGGRIDG